jgi:hypothetical protein
MTQLTGAGEPLSVWGSGTAAGGGAFGLGLVGSSAQEPSVDTDLPPEMLDLRLGLHCGGNPDRPTQAASSQPDCYADARVPLSLRGIEITLREDIAPIGSAVAGSLLGDMPVSEVRSLDYRATDAESGIARVDVVAGDIVVATRDLATRCSFADWSACPITDRDTLFIDTRSIPDGRHVLKLRTTDAAGNRNDQTIQSIEVANHQSSPSPVAPATLAQLTARFAASTQPSLIVPFGRRVSIRGRLVGASRSGLAGERIDVFERWAKAGAREGAAGSARTRRDGTFSYTLAAGRPSRDVRIAYGSTATRLLRVRVRAASTLKASLRGTIVRFSGQVLSRPLPVAGKRVILDGRAPGYPWTDFTTVRTDRRGRFAGSYRLRARRPGVKIQIRVRVPTQRGYPYLGYTGRPVMLTVR